MNIPVIYQDQWLLVVDKPAGLLVIPSPKKERRTLTSILNEDLKERGQAYRLHPCHRLDRETSGLIIYAKGKSAQGRMMRRFWQGEVRKYYTVFVQGAVRQERGRIDSRVGGLSALTEYRVLQRKRDFTIIQASPITGRTNQLRIHFKQIGHPVVGEDRFAFRKDFKLRAKRLCLHAQELEFKHPVTGKEIRLCADLPVYFKEFIKNN